ncbi:MAG: Hsp33 family molecular chaperone HslO, partial [Bacteroidaceae bacterium]|nr:Hsp33 family molecular chaperone HslO [Bacteroidaceae bacterium]
MEGSANAQGKRAFCACCLESLACELDTLFCSRDYLGRTLTATSMMGLMMKNDGDKLTVIIKGGGPIGTILAT